MDSDTEPRAHLITENKLHSHAGKGHSQNGALSSEAYREVMVPKMTLDSVMGDTLGRDFEKPATLKFNGP